MEIALSDGPYLIGERFTLADAAAYGQLAMNLSDPGASSELLRRAPRTHHWLSAISEGLHTADRGKLVLRESLRPLLEVVGETFVPLMRQNERAYLAECTRGETVFNEVAFDDDRALYDGELLGQPFRSVVKSFQVRTWRDLRAQWEALAPGERDIVAGWLPGFDQVIMPLE